MVHENRKKSINPSVIAVIVLLAIALVSGLLLSVLNDILYISDEERTARDLSKVYQSESFTQLTIVENFKSKDEYGEIVYVYQAADGAYVIKAKGIKGWNGKSEIVMAIKDNTIVNMIVSFFGGDDKKSTINDKYLAQYYGMEVTNDLVFVMNPTGGSGEVDVSAGATSEYTMTSICAAANMSVYYYNNVLKGGAEA